MPKNHAENQSHGQNDVPAASHTPEGSTSCQHATVRTDEGGGKAEGGRKYALRSGATSTASVPTVIENVPASLQLLYYII